MHCVMATFNESTSRFRFDYDVAVSADDLETLMIAFGDCITDLTYWEEATDVKMSNKYAQVLNKFKERYCHED